MRTDVELAETAMRHEAARLLALSRSRRFAGPGNGDYRRELRTEATRLEQLARALGNQP